MDEASTSDENFFEPISFTNEDPNTIVEAVYESEHFCSDGKSRLPNIIQTKSLGNSLETGSHRYKCPVCERGFQNVGPLKCHYGKAHRNSGPFLFLYDSSLVCKICNKSCEQKAEFDHHLKLHIKKNETEPIVQSYQCDLCHMSFPWKSSLENHYHRHNNETTYPYKIDFLDAEKLDEHYLKHSEDQTCSNCIKCSEKPSCDCGKKVFSCGICKEGFNIKKDLQSHYLTHTKKKPFKCDLCSTNFSSQGNLKRHADVHTHEKPFECEVCKKSFRHLGSLKQHCSTHTDERPYHCEVCDRSFSRRSTLEAHERTHSSERPYVCQLCNKGFTQQSSLQAHCFVHTKEKPFQCDLCNKCFSLRSKLRAHQLLHKKSRPHSNKIL